MIMKQVAMTEDQWDALRAAISDRKEAIRQTIASGDAKDDGVANWEAELDALRVIEKRVQTLQVD